MNTHNLAVVFGPSLFRVKDDENLLTNQGQVNSFIDILITEFYQIFPDEPIEDGFESNDRPDGRGQYSDDNDDGDRTEDELDSEDGRDILFYFYNKLVFIYCCMTYMLRLCKPL